MGWKKYISYKMHRLLSKGMFWIQLNRFKKEINRLLSKGISTTHLKVAIEKNWYSQISIF